MDVDARATGRQRRYASVIVVTLVVGLAVVLVASALRTTTTGTTTTGTETAGTTPAPTPAQRARVGPVRLVAVGDSITVAGGDIAAGRFTDLSWVGYAVGGPVVPWGGWAVSGATTTAMAAGYLPPAGEAYVLVVFAGTNDVAIGLPFAESRRALLAIAERSRDAARVFVTAIPPLTGLAADVSRYNADLAALAAEQGWTFIDPMGAVSADGRWLEGMSHDGIHPTAQGARLIGAGIRAALLAS